MKGLLDKRYMGRYRQIRCELEKVITSRKTRLDLEHDLNDRDHPLTKSFKTLFCPM